MELTKRFNLEKIIINIAKRLKDEIRVSEDESPEDILKEIKVICQDCIIYHINRMGAKCDTEYILWLTAAIIYQIAKLEALREVG